MILGAARAWWWDQGLERWREVPVELASIEVRPAFDDVYAMARTPIGTIWVSYTKEPK